MRACTRVLLAALLILSGWLLAGCSQPPDESEALSDAPVIRVAGSGPHLALLKTLVEMYPYRDEVVFEFFPNTHSAVGVQGVVEGALDIGGVSSQVASRGIEYHALSRDGLVLAVHPSVTVGSVSTSQVQDIYAGRITNWSELGGDDVPIVVLDRDEDSSAKRSFRRYILQDTSVMSSTVPLFYEEDMLIGLDGTPGAIAYLSLGGLLSSASRARLLELDGVKPSVETVESGEYVPVRELGLVVRTNPPRHVARFVEWAESPTTAEGLEKKGYAAPDVAAD